MSINFPPGYLAQIDRAIQKGLGVVGQVGGQQFDVRRLGTANGSITNNTPIATRFPCKLDKTTSKKEIENATFDLLMFAGKCDALEYLQVGDVLTESVGTPGYTGASYTMVMRRPPRRAIFVRTEANATITRQVPDGGQPVQQPPSGAVDDGDLYFGVYKAGEYILTLKNGLYAFISPAQMQAFAQSGDPRGTPAVVPAGIQQLNRVRDANKPDIPVTHYRDHYVGFVPMLPGDILQEMDIVNYGNGDRYQCASTYTSDGVGVSGYVIVFEKLA